MLRLCGCGLLAMASVTLMSYVALHATSSTDGAADHDEDLITSSRAYWLRLHPPQQAHHDAEMLRRRKLAMIVEASDAEIQQHAVAIVWSLDHEDEHVRHLALSMLSRLNNASLTQHAALLAERLESPDDGVRLGVVKALTLATPQSLAPSAQALSDLLADSEPAVRWAALDALNVLRTDSLASVTLSAIDRLVEQQDISLAQTAIGAWAERLDPTSDAHSAVTDAMSRLGMAATQKASEFALDHDVEHHLDVEHHADDEPQVARD
jgi:hypothetical protein